MLRVATLNVWFDEKLREARTGALVSVIKALHFEVVCLQEVVPEVAKHLMRELPEWSSSDPGDGSSVYPYGVMTLVAPGGSPRFSFHELPTQMCRKLLVTHVSELTVASVHLESLNNHPTRVSQLRECAKVLAPFQNVLLLGDFNFDSDRNFDISAREPLENGVLAQVIPEYVDLWLALRREPGKTFDSTVNPFIRKPEIMRYDRVMTRLTGWNAVSIEMFGDQPVDDVVELSNREREHLERPPTPDRPIPGPRKNPFEFEDVPESLQQNSSTSTACPLFEQRSTPPRSRPRLFLSDHFGLSVCLEQKTPS
mmetsp:Transcript_116777/g.183638  ORF Transcript_116777/g.183638 Transcript_116777/m.183638 type:complete len:311 (-) Transcript_116777:231-1163(-)